MKYLDNIGVEFEENILKKDLTEVMKCIANEEVVVFREQDITAKQFVDVLRPYVKYSNANHWCTHPDHPEIFRVTNKKIDDEGRMGFFGDGELDWHCNSPLNEKHEEIVALYCVEPDETCHTSFCNIRKAWNDLPEDIQEKCRKSSIVLRFKNNTIYDYKEYELRGALDSNEKRGNYIPKRITKMVKNHPYTGEEYLYFPYAFYHKCDEDLVEYLKDFVLQDKYVYHHQWKKGDVLLFDQLIGLHRRTAIDLKSVGKPNKPRELYRTVSWYNSW
tara:strand:- start:1479 stop:2300 length:822 start_codon:yes stop_codon:yes gene_type:complete